MDLPSHLFSLCFFFESNVLTLKLPIFSSIIDPRYMSEKKNNSSEAENWSLKKHWKEAHPNSPQKNKTKLRSIS